MECLGVGKPNKNDTIWCAAVRNRGSGDLGWKLVEQYVYSIYAAVSNGEDKRL